MLGGMMQSIGVGGTVEASEIGILDSLTIESSDTNKPYIIMQESGNSGDFVFGRGSTAVSGGGADDLGIRTNSGNMLFATGGVTERMRIDSTGNVGIGTTNPSAKLDITSTTGGFLPPRMTTTQRNAISSPATGLVIYNTTDNVLNFYNGTSWGAV